MILPHLLLLRLSPIKGGVGMDTEPVLVMLTTALKQPMVPVFHAWTPCNVGPGQIAWPANGFIRHLELVKHLTHMATPHYRIEQLRYSWWALDRIKISSVEDITGKLSVKRGNKAADITKFVKDFGKLKEKRVRKKPDAEYHAGRRMTTTKGEDSDIQDMDDADPNSQPESEPDAPGQVVEGQAGPPMMLFDVCAMAMLQKVMYCEREQQHNQPDLIIADCAPSDSPLPFAEFIAESSIRPGGQFNPADVHDAEIGEESPDPEWKELHAEVDDLPRWDEKTQQVHAVMTNGAAKSGDIIGRMKLLHVGEAQEALSFYCRLHQCSPPLQRTSCGLPDWDLRRWFRLGQELGRGAQHKQAHLKFFTDMMQEHRSSTARGSHGP